MAAAALKEGEVNLGVRNLSFCFGVLLCAALKTFQVQPQDSASSCLKNALRPQQLRFLRRLFEMFRAVLQTTILAVKFREGVVLGADSRTTTGSYIANRVTDKLTPVVDRILCCRSGSAADTQAVSDIVKYQLRLHESTCEQPPSVETAARLFQSLCYENKHALMAGIIVAGYDAKNGPKVFNVPLGGSLHDEPFSIGGKQRAFSFFPFVNAFFRLRFCVHLWLL